MAEAPLQGSPAGRTAHQHWTVVLALFSITSVVETIGVSQVFAFMPLYLERMGLAAEEVPRWVGILSSLVFVFGLPLVPLWGVWADKYSRKAVIVRSALVEALVFALVALSRQPWELAGSLLLVGFQLGNTGVMLAALRDLTPPGRLGTAIAVFGVSAPVGLALGPALGGILVDRLSHPLSSVYWLAASLSLGTAVMLAVGFREVRPAYPPAGRVLDLAYRAILGVLTDPATRRLFALYGAALLARQMSTPFLPILVQQLTPGQSGQASAVALVVGTAALAGGVIAPVAGPLGDHIGFRPVLAGALLGAGLSLIAMPEMHSVSALALANVVFAAMSAAITAMIFGLLAAEVRPDRTSTTLNLVYLPLYIAGIVGPATGSFVVEAGLPAVFLMGGAVVAAGAAWVLWELVRTRVSAG